MMTPGPITLLATIADAQRAAGLALAPDAVAAMTALRDLLLRTPWVAEMRGEVEAQRRMITALQAELHERRGAPSKASKPRKARAVVEPRPGTRAAADLADARAWKAAGDPRGGSLEKAILRTAREEADHAAFRAAHPGPVLGRITWLDADGRPCLPPRDLRSWCEGRAGLAEWDPLVLHGADPLRSAA